MTQFRNKWVRAKKKKIISNATEIKAYNHLTEPSESVTWTFFCVRVLAWWNRISEYINLSLISLAPDIFHVNYNLPCELFLDYCREKEREKNTTRNKPLSSQFASTEFQCGWHFKLFNCYNLEIFCRL